MRNLNEVANAGGEQYPPPGQYICRCIAAIRWISPVKRTPAVKLTWRTQDGESEFSDLLFLTPKALGRLAHVAKNVCAVSNIELSDDDDEAIVMLERLILGSVLGLDSLVTIEEDTYEDIHQSGPQMGEKYTRRTRRVAFRGYELIESSDVPTPEPPVKPLTEPPADDDDLPF